jgi:hypothetical protein
MLSAVRYPGTVHIRHGRVTTTNRKSGPGTNARGHEDGIDATLNHFESSILFVRVSPPATMR